ncbi:MAG TPA: hypothetical protein VGX78_20280 [Pirellulales bacterium]|jgi:hypothetical protein|nr:hypothetical protein [Pirellulales bacterium]
MSKKKRKAKRPKRKLTAAEKRGRRERRKKFMTIFINGKQKRVPREPTIEGLPVDEYIRRNADPIWLHQNGFWELIPWDDKLMPQDDELMLADDERIPSNDEGSRYRAE